MKSSGFQANYCFSSIDSKDIPEFAPRLDWRKEEPSEAYDYLAELAAESEYVVAIAGVGGKSGSYLLPKVCSVSRREGKPVFAAALLPFSRQKWMEFKAATALTKVKKVKCGLIVIDREHFISEEMKETQIESIYQLIDERVSVTMVALLSRGEEVVSVFARGQAAMELADVNKGFKDSLAELLTRTIGSHQQEFDDMYIVSAGNRQITLGDSDVASSAIRNLSSPSSRIHYVNNKVGDGYSVLAIVGHTSSLNLRVRDPLDEVLGSRWIDPEAELGAEIHIPISRDIDRID